MLGCSELNEKRGLFIARMCVTAYFVRFEFLAEARKLREDVEHKTLVQTQIIATQCMNHKL